MNQPNYKLYMSEALRRTKMAESEKINQFRAEWSCNFVFGTDI